MKKGLAAAALLLLLCLCFGSCGGDGEEASGSTDTWFPGSLTETSVENPGAWYSVTAVSVE